MAMKMWWAQIKAPKTGRELWVRTRRNGELNDGDTARFGTRGPVPRYLEVDAATVAEAKKALAAGKGRALGTEAPAKAAKKARAKAAKKAPAKVAAAK